MPQWIRLRRVAFGNLPREHRDDRSLEHRCRPLRSSYAVCLLEICTQNMYLSKTLLTVGSHTSDAYSKVPMCSTDFWTNSIGLNPFSALVVFGVLVTIFFIFIIAFNFLVIFIYCVKRKRGNVCQTASSIAPSTQAASCTPSSISSTMLSNNQITSIKHCLLAAQTSV